ncbi:FAD-dependent oxidoreductase [Nocardioides sp. NPDC006273]|uniref:NAD(P)/FAD-dependent oxidoreductase n=1 Tax=Nocardioides sp. NPDC006273 TaxID=3155598 RepID=UPI0033BBDC5F
MTQVVIVGGGIGGVSCAAALRTHGYAGELVLIESSELPYDRPPLSKDYLAGQRDLKEIALHPAEWYAEQRIELLAPAEVAGLTPAEDEVGVVLVDGRRLEADRVVLATGGRAAVPPVPGLHDAREAGRAHVLRAAADADRLRATLVPGARLLVVGGGLIGAETASTARELGCEVVLVDPLDPPIAAAVGQQVARWLHDQHAAYGIETVTTTLESVQVTGGGVAAQLHGEPDSRTFDAVLVGVGMVPETGLAEAAGLEVDRGVLVDEDQVTSHPRVLAIGDSARLRDHPRTEHWEAAQRDGERAAATILGGARPAGAASWFWTDRHHRHVEGVGTMREPDAEHAVVLRGEPGESPFSAFTLHAGRVIGAVAVDDSQAVRAARRLIDRGIAVDPELLADPATNLRKLLRG